MSGGTVIAGGLTVGGLAAGVGAAAGLASSVNNLVNSSSPANPGGSSGGGSGSGSGGGFGSGSPFYGLSPYTSSGVKLSTHPEAGQSMEGTPQKEEPLMQADKAAKAPVATAREAPTQGAAQNAAQGKQDYNNMWADRLSRYLDYNTRELG